MGAGDEPPAKVALILDIGEGALLSIISCMQSSLVLQVGDIVNINLALQTLSTTPDVVRMFLFSRAVGER